MPERQKLGIRTIGELQTEESPLLTQALHFYGIPENDLHSSGTPPKTSNGIVYRSIMTRTRLCRNRCTFLQHFFFCFLSIHDRLHNLQRVREVWEQNVRDPFALAVLVQVVLLIGF